MVHCLIIYLAALYACAVTVNCIRKLRMTLTDLLQLYSIKHPHEYLMYIIYPNYSTFLNTTNVVEVGELVLVHKLDTESIHTLPLVGVAVESSLGSLGSPGTCLSLHTPQVLVCPLLHMWGFVMGWT